ncbi:NAD(P)/FAD-dependent oxidoreductase [Mesorhizobium sp. KR9-304]|uniref:flavin-containing monooxygenase n=1 Tax=Mesorhizobium sp. KR9-304 TaxID=3156614 RepID=UPI0032B525BD
MHEGLVQADRPVDISLDRSAGLRIAIVGGGISGIAAAWYLKRAKLDNFLVFESSSEPGGTWHDNRYPGAEVDIACHLYSFSFNRYDWTQRFGSQAEVKRYLEKTIDEFGLRSRFRFGATVVSAAWSDEKKLYTVSFADGRTAEFEAVISCVGFLSVPVIPPGIDLAAYPGIACHTARWPDDISLAGKRVGVIGTGSSAVQIVPEAAKVAKSVTIFQRSPNWILPKKNRIFTARQRTRYQTSWQYRFKALKEFLRYEWARIGRPERLGSKINRRMRTAAEAYLRRSLAERPDLVEKLLPDHPLGAKRAVASGDFYAAVQQPHVAIAPAVARMDADGLIDEEGNRHELDVVVLATGFSAADYLSRLEVVGRNGADLHTVWSGEPAAFLGSCVPGFPNFFMLDGPNSNSGTLLFILECQARFAADCLAAMVRAGGATVEVRRSAFDGFNRRVQERLEKSVYKTTRNYYAAASGRIVTQWPFSATRFWWMTRATRRSSMKID